MHRFSIDNRGILFASLLGVCLLLVAALAVPRLLTAASEEAPAGGDGPAVVTSSDHDHEGHDEDEDHDVHEDDTGHEAHEDEEDAHGDEESVHQEHEDDAHAHEGDVHEGDVHEGDVHEGELHAEDLITLSASELDAFGIKLATASSGELSIDTILPGEVAVNADRMAHVTPRIPGVVRTVHKTIGDEVKPGELMAVLDSSEMGDAKLAYLTALTEVDLSQAAVGMAEEQLGITKSAREVAASDVGVAESEHDVANEGIAVAANTLANARDALEVSQTSLEWQHTVHQHTVQLLARLKAGVPVEELTQEFKDKQVGDNRTQLLTAYAALGAAKATYDREKKLLEKQISSQSEYLEAQKEYVSAKTAFESLHEQVEFQNRLGLMQAEQAVEAAQRKAHAKEQEVKSAEQALRVAKQGVRAAEQQLKAANIAIQAAAQAVQAAKQALQVSQSTLLTQERKLHILGLNDADIERLAQNAQESHADVTRHEVKAPFTGTIIQKHIAVGEVLKDDSEIYVIADLGSVWVNLSVYQKDLAFVQRGQSVTISAEHGMQGASGRISWVSPIVDEHTRTAMARVVLPNPDGVWRPGMFVTTRIAAESVAVPVLIPKGAIQTVEDRPSVFVQTDEGFAPQPVTTVRSNGTHVEVTSGLIPGQRYVVEGAFTLKAELGKGSFGDGHAH